MMALAGQCDDARTRADRELGCEHANAAAGAGDQDRFTRTRSDGAHGREPGHAGDEQCAATSHGIAAGFGVSLAASTTTYSAWLARLSV
jgi:hypothetical protein